MHTRGVEREERPEASLEERGQGERSEPSPRSLAKDHAKAAVAAARTPSCERFSGLWFVSASTRRAVPQRCQSWGCYSCSNFKRLAAVYLIHLGIEKAHEQGRRVRFVTLTDGARGAMTTADLYKAWTKLCLRLRRRALLGEYVAVVEAQARGALHLHVLMAESDRGGGWVAQAELSELVAACGFGPICDIRLVETRPENAWEVADYFAKSVVPIHDEATDLGSYVAKASRSHALAERSGKRVRPLRKSNGWYGGGLSEAEAALRDLMRGDSEKDEGPWVMWHEKHLADGEREISAR